jgi:hypothetical protein
MVTTAVETSLMTEVDEINEKFVTSCTYEAGGMPADLTTCAESEHSQASCWHGLLTLPTYTSIFKDKVIAEVKNLLCS